MFKVSEEKIRAARDESQELGRNWKEAQIKLDRIRGELEESERKKLELDDRQKEHKAIAGDLQVFVEVLTTFCQDRRSEAEIRSSEEKLKRELADMKDKVFPLEPSNKNFFIGYLKDAFWLAAQNLMHVTF